MSAPLYGTGPATSGSVHQAPAPGLGVASRVIRLDHGWFSLSLAPGPVDQGTGLPGVRVSLPPGPAGRRESVTISTIRGDGWMTADDDPILLRVAPGGADVMVTEYWSAADPAATPPALKLTRLNPEAPVVPANAPVAPVGPGINTLGSLVAPMGAAVQVAEIVAHVEGVGDVEGRVGEWIGMRGSGRAIEGFGLTPRQGLSPADFEIRAVLGRDWLSPWLPGGSFCGSRGLALPLRGFCLRLRPAAAARLELACFARFVDGSEVGPVGSDRICASANLAALEAFQVLARPRMG